MIIHYPCICKFDNSTSPLSQHYKELKECSVNSCVEAARSVIMYITQQDGVADLPWWCVLHYFVSAAAILMLVCVRDIGYSNETAALNLLDNALRWLEAPAKTDLACQRIHVQFSMLLKQVRIILMQR